MISREQVCASADKLGGFPRVVVEIIETLDDPDSSLRVLSSYVRQDPVVAARVLSQANRASRSSRGSNQVRDVFTAISLIGMGQVRQIALIGSVSSYINRLLPPEHIASFWRHSVAVGICSEELAQHVSLRSSREVALITGLLHDIGQAWLHFFDPDRESLVWQRAANLAESVEIEEAKIFGVDHTLIGAWLTEHWGLPSDISRAIQWHHAPDATPPDQLSALVHVAEILANALDLGRVPNSRVKTISRSACRLLGITWDEKSQALFGRIDARCRQIQSQFLSAGEQHDG